METIESPYDDWSRHIHAVITVLKPYFDDWRSYASLVSTILGIGILVMENQVLLRMRMGRWEILGYVVWCILSAFLGPIFDILVMIALFIYCRRKSARMHITQESIAKALLPAPVARNYTIMGAVCVTATVLTLISNVLYMLRGWQEPLPFYDRASSAIRWMTSQIWYAIGMIFLFHVVTRPAQSGVVLFGKFPRDLWGFKWHLCILYVPVNYLLLELCDVHRENAKVLIPLEILVDVCLYNGPFLVVLLRLLYLAWKVAYDEAVLTGAIFEDEEAGVESPIPGLFRSDRSTRVSSGPSPRNARGGSSRHGGGNYVGLAMVDLDETEHSDGDATAKTAQTSAHKGKGVNHEDDSDEDVTDPTTIYVLDDEGDYEEDMSNVHEHVRLDRNSLHSLKSKTSTPTSPSSPRKGRSAARTGSPRQAGSPPATLAVSTSPCALTPRSTSPSGYRSPKSTSPSPSSYTSRGSPLRNVAYSSTFDDPSSTEDDDEDGQGDDQANKLLFSSA